VTDTMATVQPTAVPQGRVDRNASERRPSTSDSEEEELPPHLLDTQQRLGLVYPASYNLMY